MAVMRANRGRGGRAARRGVSAIEFALTLPVFLLVVMATIEISWFISFRYDIQRAAREGARIGSMVLEGPQPTGDLIVVASERQALETLEAMGRNCVGACDVRGEWMLHEGYRYIRVNVVYPYPSLVPGMGLTPMLAYAQFTMLTQQQ